MDWETVTGVWLEPGTDFRKQQREDERRHSPKFGRLPLGEKGVGRFAAGKLGDKIRLITRAKGQPEIVVDIDWNEFLSHDYLSDALVTIKAGEPKVFKDERTGTALVIGSLRENWSRGMVRNAQRALTSVCSPFVATGSFTPGIASVARQWLVGRDHRSSDSDRSGVVQSHRSDMGGQGPGQLCELRLRIQAATKYDPSERPESNGGWVVATQSHAQAAAAGYR